MKAIILAAAAALTLGTGAAFAQGLPPSVSAPVYGSKAFADQPYHNGTVFSELFSHKRPIRTATEQPAPSAKGV